MTNTSLLKASTIAALTLAAAASSAPAFAAGPIWATIGAGCVPAGQTTQSNIHFNTAGRTVFSAGKIGEIILTCAVSAQLGTPNGLSLSYIDPDGVNLGARVTATLRRVDRFNGAVSSVKGIDSNLSSRTTFGSSHIKIGNSGCGEYTFDHNRFYYYVQINMYRTSALQGVSFGGVAIETVVC